MRIVIDTNVVISGTFFGGCPRKVIESVGKNGLYACATLEIVNEYEEIVDEMIRRKQGLLRRDILKPFIDSLKMMDSFTKVEVSRDPDDDKFISCAVDAKALYIVSGDKDLLEIGRYRFVEILTAAEFCAQHIR